MWFFDGTPESIADEDRAFVARVVSTQWARRIQLGELLPEEEETLLDLISRVDVQWTGRIRLGNLPMNVASYFPWRQLKCAPEVFAQAMFPSLGHEEDIPQKSESPSQRALTHYLFDHNLIPNNTILMRPYENGPIEGYIAYVLTRCYDEQTGAGQWVYESLPKLQQLGDQFGPADRASYLNFLDKLMNRSPNPFTPIYYEYSRRRLERDGIDDLLLPFFVGRIANLIDLKIDLATSQGAIPRIAERHDPNYQPFSMYGFPPNPPSIPLSPDPNYDRIIRVVQRFTGYWDNPRIIQAAVDAATKLNHGQIDHEEATAQIEDAMYNVGKQAYERALRPLRVAIGRRLYAPGSRGAQEAIAAVRQRASQQQPH
jgi:hypothetical protein